MTEIFTEEWITLLDVEVQAVFQDFDWAGSPPSDSLNITYHIKSDLPGEDTALGKDAASGKNTVSGKDTALEADAVFSYHLQLRADEIRVVFGEATDNKATNNKATNNNVKNVSFSQSQDIALGIMEGKLDSHTEFLTGKIQVEGDVLALQEYEQVLEKLSQTIAAVNAKLIN